MLPADAQEIAIAGHHHYVQLRASHLHAHGDGQGTTMNPVEPVRLLAFKQVNQVAGATDPGHHHVVFNGLAGLFQPVNHGQFQRPAHAEVAAAGAPFEIVFGIFLAHARTISLRWELFISAMRVTRSRTLKGRPVYWVIDSALTPWERRMLENCPW